MNQHYYPDRLLLARQLRSLSQVAACRLVGLKQPLLSKAERGLTTISPDQLQQCADAYQLPLSFFKAPTPNAAAGHFYYRRKLSISEYTIAAFEARIYILLDIIDNVMQDVELPPCTLADDSLANATPQEAAQKVRFLLKIYRGAMPNLTTLLENNGIIVLPFDFGTDAIDGTSTISPRGHKVIFINSTMPNDRVRFSMAHELGHLILHVSRPPESHRDPEAEANAFAAELLMPAAEIVQDFHKLKFDELAQLKRKWGVSMRALVQRARDTNFANQQTYRNLQIAFSKRGYNKHEPVDIPAETPTLMAETLRLLQSELQYSKADLYQLMRISPELYKEWFEPRCKIITFTPRAVK